MSAPHIEFVYEDTGSYGTVKLVESVPSHVTWEKAQQRMTPLRPDETRKLVEARWPSHAWPGGYEIHYYTDDWGVLCHQCANAHLGRTLDPDDDQFFIVDAEINYETDHLTCDHCGRVIEPVYGVPDETA